MFVSLNRIIKSGFKGFYRNSIISFSAILILIITLLTLSSVYLGGIIIDASLKQLELKVDVNVYFTKEAEEEKILEIKKQLQELETVDSVIYTSKEKALAEFKKRHRGDDVILKTLEAVDDNPLTANVAIKAKEISQYEDIANFLDDKKADPIDGDIIDDVNYYENKIAIDKLNSLFSYTKKISYGISIVLIIVSMIITFNTIRLTIYVSRNELAVMRLVGASKAFARGPFLVEGILYGLISGLITIAILLPTLKYLAPKLNEIFILNIYDHIIENILPISACIILTGVILGLVSSYLATAKYLKV